MSCRTYLCLRKNESFLILLLAKLECAAKRLLGLHCTFNLQCFLVVSIALQVAGTIASCNTALLSSIGLTWVINRQRKITKKIVLRV